MAAEVCVAQRLPFSLASLAHHAGGNVQRIGFLLPKLRLRQEAQQVIVAAVRVVQDDLLESVAPDLVQHTLQQIEQQRGPQGERAGEGARLVDLPKIKQRKDHRRLLLGSQAGQAVPDQRICAERQMLTVLFQHPQAQHTNASFLHRRGKIRGGQIFPLHIELLF